VPWRSLEGLDPNSKLQSSKVVKNGDRRIFPRIGILPDPTSDLSSRKQIFGMIIKPDINQELYTEAPVFPNSIISRHNSWKERLTNIPEMWTQIPHAVILQRSFLEIIICHPSLLQPILGLANQKFRVYIRN
jgi:hypothetical protein